MKGGEREDGERKKKIKEGRGKEENMPKKGRKNEDKKYDKDK